MPPEPAADRVLFLAPHPDDEVLALGATLADAVRAGAAVRVVFLTGGDAYPWAAIRRFRAPATRATLRRLADLRAEEARRAAAALGVEPLFLGFPDRGLADLWLQGWDRPLASRYTGRCECPGDAFAPGAPYTAPTLLAVLEGLLRDWRPARVYYPSTLDDHPDHWATGCFATLALARARIPAAERTYLVHRGRWPEGPRTAPLAPPPELAPFPPTWEPLTPSPAGLTAKETALACHATQLAVSGAYLRSFLRPNELCAAPAPPAAWGEWIADAVADRFQRRLLPGADLVAFGVFPRAGGGALRVRLRGAPTRGLSYRVHWLPLSEAAPRVRTAALGRQLEHAIPAEDLIGDLLIAASVWGGGFQWDRTPWSRVRRPREA